MPPTREEVRARLQGELRNSGATATPGGQFRQSALARRLASGLRQLDKPETVEVTRDPWELADFLRARAFDTSALSLMADAERIIQVRPTPAAFLGLVTIVPTASVQIPTVPESLQIEDASYTPDAVNLPGLDGTNIDGANVAAWTVDYLEAVRVGRIIPVPLTILQDVGQAEATIDRLITQNWARAIEGYLVSGNVTNLVGVTETVGTFALDATGEVPSDALGAGVAAVTSSGFYGPHAVVANPRTLKAIFLQKDSVGNYLRLHSTLPTVAAWVPAPGLPDGTAVVCDPAELVLYLQGVFSIQMSQGYLDFIARGLVAVKGEQRAAIWVRNPTAFAVVDNITTS